MVMLSMLFRWNLHLNNIDTTLPSATIRFDVDSNQLTATTWSLKNNLLFYFVYKLHRFAKKYLKNVKIVSLQIYYTVIIL